MPSAVSICNQALSWLGEDRILLLDPAESVNARLCWINYANLRDAVLEEASWTFATRRYALDPIAEAAEYGYSNKFLIPSEILTVIEVSDNASFYNGVSDLDWRREEDYIVSDAEVIYAKCIVKITDPNKFSNLFVQALATRLAAELAPTLTESKTKTDQMWSLYQLKLAKAIPTDGKQGRNDRIRGRSLIRVR